METGYPNITPKQLQVLTALGDIQARQCYSATIAELAQALGVSRPTVYEHLVTLREKGLVSSIPGKARSLQLTEPGKELLESAHQFQDHESVDDENFIGSQPLQLVGTVSAGYGIDAIETPEPVSMESMFGHSEDLFMLQVHGQSMKNVGIQSGDFVICKRTNTAANGQLVIALLEGENATVKRFYKERTSVCLMPENEDFEAIYSSECQIQGVVIGLIRHM